MAAVLGSGVAEFSLRLVAFLLVGGLLFGMADAAAALGFLG